MLLKIKTLMLASMPLCLLLVATAQEPSIKTSPVGPASATAKRLCVLNAGGLPVTVSFEQSFTIAQAISLAGVAREDVKNKASIIRREPTGEIRMIPIDLRSLEKKPRIELKDHDLIALVAKKKKPGPDIQTIATACMACGCRIVPGMHGPLILP